MRRIATLCIYVIALVISLLPNIIATHYWGRQIYHYVGHDELKAAMVVLVLFIAGLGCFLAFVAIIKRLFFLCARITHVVYRGFYFW